MSDLREASDYVTREGDTLAVDHMAMLADLTGTEAVDWKDSDGPDTGCGVDHYYFHGERDLDARVNDDQGMIGITVLDADGEEIADGQIDISGI